MRKAVLLNRACLTLVCLIFTLAAGLQTGFAQSTQQQEKGEAQVTLNLQDVDIRVLINTVAEVSGKNFIVDPRVKGKVSVISGASLDPEQLYDVFLSILEVHNFATVDSGTVIKVLPSNVIKQRPTPTLFSPTEDTNDAQITQIIQLDHATVQDLVPIIRPLIPPSSHFAPHVASNSVVITDTAANIQRVLKIIRRIDIPDKRANTRIIYLDHARASDLAASLTQLLSAGGNAAGQPAGQPPAINVQPLDAINALLITATDDAYGKIQALIDQLDIERELASDVNVIYLKHANATDLVSILNDVTASAAEGTVSDFSVQADEATNSLIVKASGSQLKAVKGVVEKLDLRRAQVFVETIIAEVSLDQTANLGLDFSAGGPRVLPGGDTTPPTDGGDGAPAAPPAPAGGTVGNIVSRDNPNQIIGTGSVAFNMAGLNLSLLNFDRFNITAILDALRSDTNSNVLSTPTLLTLDNESAEIVVGQEVPFVTGQFNNGFNNSTTVDGDGNATGGTTGSSFQTIERRDVGILLRITPQISDGNTIQLEVLQEISSVAPTVVGGGAADLITNRRSIETVVQVDDGQVIALGGLLQDEVTDTEVRVPFLGRLPILGRLFKNTSKSSGKSNLMIFLKPRIIRTADQLAKYSKGKYDEIRLDTELARLKSSDFFIDDGELPVLDDYKNITGDGTFTYEQRRQLIEKYKDGVPRHRGINALIFGKGKRPNGDLDIETPENEFKTDGYLDNSDLDSTELDRIESELRDEQNRVEWGEDSNRIPKPSSGTQPIEAIEPTEVLN